MSQESVNRQGSVEEYKCKVRKVVRKKDWDATPINVITSKHKGHIVISPKKISLDFFNQRRRGRTLESSPMHYYTTNKSVEKRYNVNLSKNISRNHQGGLHQSKRSI